MIDAIQFNQETRQFSKIQVIKCIGGYRFAYNYSSRPAKELVKQVISTLYPYNYFKSIYTIREGSDKIRMISLMDGLRSQCKEVPVIRAKKFNNACYIQNLDIISQDWIESDFEDLCDEWGIDLNEFKKSIGPHIVILGDRYACPPVLAHEFGHYLNTIGKGSKKGFEAHKKYGQSARKSDTVRRISTVTSLTGTIISTVDPNTGSAIMGASGVIRLSELAISRPIIIAESCASQTAIENLTKLGATQEELESYKKSLKEALGTYKWAYQYIPAIMGGIKLLAGGVGYAMSNH